MAKPEPAGAAIVSLITALILLILMVWLDSAACHGRWEGTEHRWGFPEGCMVKLPSGRWVPEDSVRGNEAP